MFVNKELCDWAGQWSYEIGFALNCEISVQLHLEQLYAWYLLLHWPHAWRKSDEYRSHMYRWKTADPGWVLFIWEWGHGICWEDFQEDMLPNLFCVPWCLFVISAMQSVRKRSAVYGVEKMPLAFTCVRALASFHLLPITHINTLIQPQAHRHWNLLT